MRYFWQYNKQINHNNENIHKNHDHRLLHHGRSMSRMAHLWHMRERNIYHRHGRMLHRSQRSQPRRIHHIIQNAITTQHACP